MNRRKSLQAMLGIVLGSAVACAPDGKAPGEAVAVERVEKVAGPIRVLIIDDDYTPPVASSMPPATFIGCGGPSSPPPRHGTSVAAILWGNLESAESNTELYFARIGGLTDDTEIAEVIACALNQVDDLGIHVVNVSLQPLVGLGDVAEEVRTAINSAAGHAVIVFAAGNYQPPPHPDLVIGFPANHGSVLAVTNFNGSTINPDSKRGLGVADIAGQGTSVTAPWVTLSEGVCTSCTGTSYSAPQVAAAAVRIIHESPVALTASDVTKRLKAGASHNGSYDLGEVGAGMLSVFNSLGISSTYDLVVNTSGAGNVGSLTSSSKIYCGASGPQCSMPYKTGTGVALSAAPVSGSTFGGWSGACGASGLNPSCTTAGAGGTTVQVQANFGTTRTLDVNVTGSGRVQSAAAPIGHGINCNFVLGGSQPSCVTYVAQGFAVSLTATATGAFDFLSWSGCNSVSGNVCSVTPAGNSVVTAEFRGLYDLRKTNCTQNGSNVRYQLSWSRTHSYPVGSTYEIRHSTNGNVTTATLMASGATSVSRVNTPNYSGPSPRYHWIRAIVGGVPSGWVASEDNPLQPSSGCL